MGSGVERTCVKEVAGGLGQVRQQLVDQARWQLAERAVPHLCVDKLGGTTRDQDR